MTLSIQPLKKVDLAILAGTEQGRYNLTSSSAVFQFIHGIGTEGFEPFEIALNEKSPGEVIILTLTAGDAPAFFGRFFGRIRNILGLHLVPSNLFIHITVTAVTDADNREVVKALAGSAGHGGCGGSCDCGCGHAQ